jgi:outer membrane receptor protein involved in Fe transport
VANPTTQGVTLRGLAASGSSRALVLADGVPLNDPVGGWVYWNRIPLAALQEASVSRGAAGDTHGGDALAGIVTLTSARDESARLLLEGGTDATARLSAYGGTGDHNRVFAAAEGFTTDGFVTVAPDVRGTIDTAVNSRYYSAFGALALGTPAADLTFRAAHFDESRENGTPVQRNATRISQMTGLARGLTRAVGWFGTADAATQDYEQTFSAVLEGRSAERLTSEQQIGATSAGAQAEIFTAASRGGFQVTGQSALRHVSAELNETAFAFNGGPMPSVQTDASQLTAAAGIQATVHRGVFAAGTGFRTELWRASDRNSHVVTTPKAWITWLLPGGLSVMAAARGGFRGPTINELYRGFRVGNVITAPNALLTPERARSVEGGVVWSRTRLTLRALGFWSRVDDAVVNVTVESTGGLIVRERQNAARIRAAGTELEAEVRLSPHLRVTMASAYTDSIFTEGPLTGLRVPQVARLQHAIGGSGTRGPFRGSVDWRFVGSQFDDDRNVFLLDQASTLDARIGWKAGRRTEVFVAMENVLDGEQEVGRTPLRTLGLPRTSRAGVRVVFP